MRAVAWIDGGLGFRDHMTGGNADAACTPVPAVRVSARPWPDVTEARLRTLEAVLIAGCCWCRCDAGVCGGVWGIEKWCRKVIYSGV